jgi:hypothetical protein
MDMDGLAKGERIHGPKAAVDFGYDRQSSTVTFQDLM